MASKSKKRRRVFRASCILAALIIAGSSFAWFTSSDEVTNRLSASSDYGVSIVESFAPPKNWLPGDEVDKDTYATNTGSIAAYVRNDVSGVLTITKEGAVTEGVTWANGVATLDPDKVAFGNLVTLDNDEVYSTEAGAYLAYAPTGSGNEVGRQIVTYPSTAGTPVKIYKKNSAGGEGDPATMTEAEYTDSTIENKENKYDLIETTSPKTDFTPTTKGLYVFRRTIDVDANALETFTYDAYYFNDGVYYKVTDLKLTSDDAAAPADVNTLDAAGDNKDNDGILSGAEAKFLRDETKVINQPDKFEYDAENNRLIATYGTDDRTAKLTTYETDAKALDKAEHELAEARVALDKAIRDDKTSDDLVNYWKDVVAQLNAEITAVTNRMTAIGDPTSPAENSLIGKLNAQKTTLETKRDTAETDAKNALGALYGSANNGFDATTGEFNYTEPTPAPASSTVPAGLYHDYLKAKEDVQAARANAAYGASMFEAYVNELEQVFNKTFTSYDDVLNQLSYTDLSGASVHFKGESGSTVDPELHNIHELTVELAKAKKDYDDKKAKAEDNIAEYLKAVKDLGSIGTPDTDEPVTEYIGGQTIAYTKKKVKDESGVLGQIARATAEYNTLNNKKTALNTVLANAAQKVIDSAKVGTETNTADANLTAALNNYQAKALVYDNALNTFNASKKAYEDSDSLKIYINLSDNVVTTGGVADKWQLLDTNLDNFYPAAPNTADALADTAVFYYTSILEGGETSEKLIDSVELDAGVTQGMYKYFDYDLNVALKSAQVTYAADGETILATATPKELNATAALSNDKDINTPITWSANNP